MSDIGTIPKDKMNEHFKYRYVSETAIKQKINPLLVKHRVIFTISRKDSHKDGNLTTLLLLYRFYDVESGEFIEGELEGVGQDNADKGVPKAITGAIKSIMTSTFLIPTGDDPESDQPTKPVRKAPAKASAPTEPEPQVAREPAGQRIDIVNLLARLKLIDKKQIKTIPKEKIAALVKSATDLDLVESNYDDIIGRLGVRLQEKQAA